MNLPHLFPPVQDDGSDETCSIAGETVRIKDVRCSPIAPLALPDAVWVDGGSAVLFGTPSRAIALIKICQLHTKGLARTAQTVHTYLVSVTADGENFLVRSEALDNRDAGIDAALARDIARTVLPEDATPATIIDIARTVAEHNIAGQSGKLVIHDGSVRTTNGYLRTQLMPAHAIAKTTGLLTSKSRPLGLSLLMNAPPGAWTASLSEDTALVRLHDRASHVFLVEQSTPELLSLLREWSADMAFPGYPYPLVLCDQLARVTNNERDALRAVLATDEQAMRIIMGELRASDAHDVLEHILYGKQMQ